ncbi:MAG: RNA-binding protein [Deferribacteraceae bacterium]|nr:RNA-binding protein [Deferribacteraceae bacterium]
MKRLFVGNLPFTTTDDDLQKLFASFGDVNSARVIIDKQTGRSRGFGFVEMKAELASRAMSELNDSDYGGRKIRVSEAHEREQRERSFSARGN